MTVIKQLPLNIMKIDAKKRFIHFTRLNFDKGCKYTRPLSNMNMYNKYNYLLTSILASALYYEYNMIT
mgnify:CR=1 FL=1